MKAKHYIPLPVLVVSVLLSAVSPPANPSARAADLWLSSECSSNKLTLHWYGAPGFILQQATNLANPVWQDVAGTKGMSICEIPMTNAMAFFRVADQDPLNDIDADGLDEFWETNGWDIFIDTHGYGTDGLVIRHVTSDPSMADTDGDGIEDFWEWLLGTDPRLADTDGDGLSDYDEWFRWQTSPTSVDTDGDARGPNHDLPPKAQLFDGNELRLLHTSPTLEDTDGDGRTDYEEYDQLGRNPLVAQLPKLEVQLVDAVDIRLDVEYAEEVGTSREYGGELTESTSKTETKSSSQTASASVKIGYATTVGTQSTAAWNFELNIGWEGTWTTESSSSSATEHSYSEYTTDSRTRTETAASGSMSGGIRLVNTGPVTFTLTDFGLSVRYLSPGNNGPNSSFKTLATLVPALGANGITLAPGDSTPVLQVQATGLNASRVKEFMARPNSLYLEPAFYEIENAEGLNFDYLEEVTRWRTARVQIDYGNGTNEDYRVATDVERGTDGSYSGITMAKAMSNILHIPFQTTNIQALVPTNTTNERVLYSVRDAATISPTNGFWIVFLPVDGTSQTRTNFEDIILQAGDRILLAFIRDNDGDGLFAAEEQHFGTTETLTPDSPTPGDTDGDGLPDVFEARNGWDVLLAARTYHVFSDPRTADQDSDGLTDAEEYQNKTDPTKADTDDDGIPDNLDLFPLAPGKVLHVKWDAVHGGNSVTNGATWNTALTNLQDALSLARTGLASTNDSSDDVAEIWVAAGVYKPTTTTNRAARFELVNTTSLYGGFAGVETKLSQRTPDPLLNGTVLSGDLLDNDASTYTENPGSFSDNSTNVCYAETNVSSGTVLDGFTITGGNSTTGGGGLYSRGFPELKNLMFRANHSFGKGGALWQRPSGAGELKVSDCLFLQNEAATSGGIYFETSNNICRLVLTNCLFIENSSTSIGGAVLVTGPPSAKNAIVSIDDCSFWLNTTATDGGAVYVLQGTALRISRSEFRENTANYGGAIYVAPLANGLNAAVEVVQSVFFKNDALTGSGGAINIGSSSASVSLYVLSSTFNTNWAYADGDAICGYINGHAPVVIENSIFWGNDGSHNQLDFGSSTFQVRSRVRTSCFSQVSDYPGAGNINADPKFVDGANGNLRLQSGSPCIDHGNNYADYYPTIPGFQLLPATDLDGNRRIVDGNSDGTATVDMGAYERQGQ